MKHDLFVCNCHDIDHQLIVTKFEDAFSENFEDDYVYLSIGLRRYPSIFRRIYIAVKYLIGLNTEPYHFEILLDNFDRERLVKVLSEK